ncbi:MAG: radical SAM protein [Oscillospiraceae bacterium]|nr:radical SAM protein [Oscillospiraceae bacterium]
MEYEGRICRPPMERSSFMLGVAVGCAYNRCTFCTLFKHLKYRELPLFQIEEELKRVHDLGGCPKSVFLGDGNAFGMKMDRLMTILSLIRKYFPSCEMVNMDATVTDISLKSDDELKLLYDAGVRRLYLGVESGLDDVLTQIKKDHSIQQAEQQIARLKNAGLTFNAHIMTGISGAGRGEENAKQLAAFFNRTAPERVINFSLFLHTDAPLYRDIKSGHFSPATELENLIEARRLIQEMDVPCQFDGFHDRIEVRVRGSLPRDREKMLQKLDDAIAVWSKRESVYCYVEDMPPYPSLCEQRKDSPYTCG